MEVEADRLEASGHPVEEVEVAAGSIQTSWHLEEVGEEEEAEEASPLEGVAVEVVGSIRV